MHFKGVTSIYVSFIIFSLIAILTSCTAETKEVEILNEKNQVIEKYSIDPVTKYKEGEYIRFYPSGQKAEETYYYNDTINGERKFYFESGQLDRVQHYLYGVFQGEFKSYYSNGKLSAEGNYPRLGLSSQDHQVLLSSQYQAQSFRILCTLRLPYGLFRLSPRWR